MSKYISYYLIHIVTWCSPQ